MSLFAKLVKFRKKIRINQKRIIETIIKDHSANICIFCGTDDNLTKEHVIPQWVYSHCPERFFITTTNGSEQTYNKTTVPACSDCNTNLLGALERHIKHEFEKADFKEKGFTSENLELIIIWLESLEYKFQVLDLRRKLNRVKGGEYIPYIGKMPISMFQGPLDTSPAKVFSNLRSALKVLGVKSKVPRLNSLCVLHTKNENFHFFHSSNNFIFIELAVFGVAFFYFYKENFDKHEDAVSKVFEIVKKEYSKKEAKK
ncbi:hypothetical protein DFO48_101654 [Comamonas sp. AG1104]|nr:hypothetical protein DFO48_101654 [Comamonas sp. AG1104]